MRGTGTAVLLAVVVVFTTAAGSAEGAAFTVNGSPGASKPTVAVDDAGTAHVAWAERPNPGADLLRYCRIPRGATACQGEVTLAPDTTREAFGDTQVLTPSPGRVLLVQGRCCNAVTVLYESVDGGATFAGPRPIGDIDPDEALLGPGPFTVSLVNDVMTDGIDFQAAPIAGGAPGHADVGLPLGTVDAEHIQGYSGSAALLDPVTPVVAFSDLNRSFFRVWGGSGDYNDLATWGPIQPVGAEVEPILVSGSGGLFLMTKVGSPGRYRLVARRMARSTRTFGAPRRVSAVGDPIFRDFFEDGSGHLHAAWIDNGDGDPLRYSSSADGKRWPSVRTLVRTTRDGAFNLRLATSSDGGGLVVWDANGRGPIRAVAIPKGAGGGGAGASSCPTTLKLTAKVTAQAREGCLARRKDGTFRSSDEVRVNGIDFEPSSSGAYVELDPKANTVRAAGTVIARAGPVVLRKGSLTWDLDSAVTFTGLDAFKVKLLGFPVTGTADVAFVKGGAKITANLKLPGFFGGVTGRTVLTTKAADPQGLQLDGVSFTVEEALIGALILRDLKVTFNAGFDTFEGSAQLVFPPQNKAGVKVAFGFKDGKFAHAEADVGPPVPPFPLPLTVPPGPLFLQRLGIAVSAAAGLRINGGAELTAGPAVGGKGLVRVNALPPEGFVFDFPAGKDYADLSMSGSLDVVDIPLASGHVKFRTTGLLQFGGKLGLTLPSPSVDLVGITGNVDGSLDVSTGAFSSSSKVHICAPASCFVKVAGVTVPTPLQGTGTWIVSSKGAAGCVDVAGAGVGAGVKWGSGFDVFAGGGCGLDDYQVSAGASAHIAQTGAAGVTLPAGLPQAGIKLRGEGGPPAVAVTGPRGERLQMDPAQPGLPVVRPPFVVFTVPAAQLTVVQLVKPSAGRWTVEPLAGSPPIAELRSARGLPAISVSGRLGGHARRRTLRYRVRRIAGQRVSFLERAGRAVGRIGTARGPSGTLRFSPADGPAGRREIVALVEQDGVPRAERVVARYTAPGPRTLARPRVRVRRRGSSLAIAWRPVTGASRYVVRVHVADGRRVLHTRARARRSLRVSGVARRESASVSVQAVARSGRRGATRRVTVRRARARRG